MKKVYVIYVNNGLEYEDEMEMVAGVFSSEKIASKNVNQALKLFQGSWGGYCKAYIKIFELDTVRTDWMNLP